jgi:hypothetical protein
MPTKSVAATVAAGHTLITVTRAHTRAYGAHRGEPAASAAVVAPEAEPIDQWLTERCRLDPNATCGTSNLHADWASWALTRGEYIGSIKAFALALSRRGFRRYMTSRYRGFIGLALSGAPTVEPEARPAVGPRTEERVEAVATVPSTDGTGAILALDLGTTTGWAIRTFDGLITSGTVCFRPGRFDGGGMRYLRFTNWLTEIDGLSGPIGAIYFEEVRRHLGTDSAHVFGGLMATLTAWGELRGVPYQGVPVGTIKRHWAGQGNAPKQAMIAAARARGFSPADDNEADALAILHWALDTRGGVR